MTARDLLPQKGFLRERLWIWLAGLFFWGMSAAAAALFTPLGTRLVLIWNGPADTTAHLAQIDNRLAEIEKSVSRALGEDRVIRQKAGLSYVEEPVHVGETVTLILVMERTKLGRDCRLTDWVPLFTDASNIPTPGERLNAGPVRRQIGAEPTKLRIEIVPPPTLIPGRVEVYLSMEYDCAGTRIPERSDPVTYKLLVAGR
ncbi:hypothetical protein V8J36_05250 [Frigidibacter sp. MR17.14]|uniref:hypothetical protein n=1 Tax=Frigidibacter sp. MR17.14 TaxID=3126509 RepID=UPI003012E625